MSVAMNSSSRGGVVPIWIVLHTAEGSRTVESLYNFFNGGVASSSHAGADGRKLTGPWVPDDRAAWTLRNGNPRSFNLEMCGFARWSRTQWLSTGTVDGCVNPRQMIRHAAQWVVQKKQAAKRIYGVDIPMRKLSPSEVGARKAGVFGHHDYSIGTGDGDHWDPGPNFPWDVLFSDISAIMGGGGDDDDMNGEQNDKLNFIHMVMKGEISAMNGRIEALARGLDTVPNGVNAGEKVEAWSRVWTQHLAGDPIKNPDDTETPFSAQAASWLVDRARDSGRLAKVEKTVEAILAKLNEVKPPPPSPPAA
jgi:hypothetical protein